MPATFLGSGWAFPIEIGGGTVGVAEFEESIRQSVWIILGTSLGERVMNPEFGCGLQNLVFKPYSATTRGLISYEVQHALRTWEPRIESIEVLVHSSGISGEVVQIDISYVVIATNSRQNLVYPFYLDRSPR